MIAYFMVKQKIISKCKCAISRGCLEDEVAIKVCICQQ